MAPAGRFAAADDDQVSMRRGGRPTAECEVRPYFGHAMARGRPSRGGVIGGLLSPTYEAEEVGVIVGPESRSTAPGEGPPARAVRQGEQVVRPPRQDDPVGGQPPLPALVRGDRPLVLIQPHEP